MSTNNRLLKDVIVEALKKVVSEQGYENRAIHEVAMTHRLAVHLENSGFFSGYQVDCEYNRLDFNPKKRADDSLIRPDIIIHVRGTKTNLVFIQAKKFDDPVEEVEREKERMKGDQRHLEYRYAYLVIFPKNIESVDDDSVTEIQ